MSFLTDNDDGGNSFYKRFRPLIPRPANLEAQYHHHSPAGEAMERYSSRQDFHETQQYQLLPTGLNSSNSIVGLCGASSQQPVSSRWNPTVDQLRILEDLYKRGVRTPSAEQIQYITAQLRGYGKIEGKNVFYWFQNHKARERQKRRRRMEMINVSPYPDSATNYLQTQTPTNVVPDHNWNAMRTPLILQNTVQDCEHFLRLPIPSTDRQQMHYNLCNQQGNCTYQDHKINLLPDEYEGVIHSQDVCETNQPKTLELFPMYSNNSHEMKSSDRTSGMMSLPASASVNSVEAMDSKYEDGDDEECGQQEHKNEAPCNGYFQFLPLRK